MREFRTWGRTHAARPARWESPSSEDEVAEVLAAARREGRTVRPVGSGHSWSAAAVPEGAALDLARMRRVRAVDVDARTIRVEAGIRLEEITAALDAHGLAMPILGSIGVQTIAGATSTGTHGSSLRHGCLSSLVTAMRLVTPRGDALSLDEGHPWLPAARIALGALGVVTEVTLRVAPAFRLLESVEVMPVRDVERHLVELADGHEFIKVWWFPTSPDALVFRYARTEAPAVERPVARWFDEAITNRLVFEAVLRFAGRVPAATAFINRLVVRSYFGTSTPPQRSDRAFHLAMPPRHRETELAVPVARAAPMLEEIRAAIDAEGLRINFPVEIRFVAGDDAWLGATQGEPTCQVGYYQAQSRDLAPYFATVERIGAAHGARPHWGKEFARGHEALRPLFAHFDAFAALRRELDPSGTMRSPWLDRVLGVP